MQADHQNQSCFGKLLAFYALHRVHSYMHCLSHHLLCLPSTIHPHLLLVTHMTAHCIAQLRPVDILTEVLLATRYWH